MGNYSRAARPSEDDRQGGRNSPYRQLRNAIFGRGEDLTIDVDGQWRIRANVNTLAAPHLHERSLGMLSLHCLGQHSEHGHAPDRIDQTAVNLSIVEGGIWRQHETAANTGPHA